MGIGKSKLLFAGAVSLALLSSGCGRTRSSLLPRIDVAKVMDGERGASSSVDDEQYVNNQIDAERRKQKPTVAEATDKLLASAERESGSWKDKLLGKNDVKNAAASFGTDPFLDDLDSMMSQETNQIQQTAQTQVNDFAEENAAEIFGDFEQQAQQTIAAMDESTHRAKAQAAEVFGASREDVFGEFAETTRETVARTSNNLSQQTQALADQGRRTITEGRGKMVHRFDDLFDSESQERRSLQTVASKVVQQQRQRIRDEPAQFEVAEQVAAIEPPQEVAVPKSSDNLAGMFDPPSFEQPSPAAVEPVPPVAVPIAPAAGLVSPPIESTPAIAESNFDEPFDLPTPDMIPEEVEPFAESFEPLGLPVTTVAQQDAVVTPNQPASIPTLPTAPPMPEVPAVPDFSVNDFANVDRVAADPYEDPTFASPRDQQLPPVNEFPPVRIPAEPAPRFAAAAPVRPTAQVPTVQPRIATRVQTTTVPVSSSVQQQVQPPAVAAAVLPNVNWQATQVASASGFRAPSEWTAWFLMGGAGLIILLLFAPSRRD